jgi:hypothetical protein
VYKAVVCKLSRVRKHPNADRLNLAMVQGYQVIVGLDAKDGDLGVFFPCDGALSKEHLKANKLYSTDPDTGVKMGGYFGKNGRVRAQKFRGERSDGFWQEAGGFDWCGGLSLEVGAEFDTLNGQRICEKYYTPATIRATRNSNRRTPKAVITYPTFYEHYDTAQLRNNIGKIPEGSIIYISEKLHGTSGRTGRVMPARRRGAIMSFLARLFNIQDRWVYVCGTRRTIRTLQVGGYYGKEKFRADVHDYIRCAGLHKGEIVYYEIVGFTETGRSIMPKYDISDKHLAKRYGSAMVYSYGCLAFQSKFYVYRITQQTTEGLTVDLSWDQMQARCEQLGFNVVPELDRFVYCGSVQNLLDRVDACTKGDSVLSSDHIREGVVCRVEHPKVYTTFPEVRALKYKGFHFCEMEGIKKNDETYVDVEEIS